MKKKIFITTPLIPLVATLLEEKGYDVTSAKKQLSHKQLCTALRKAPYEAIVCSLNDTIDAAVFDAVPTLKIVATYSVGYNTIAIDEAKKRGISVTNTPGSSGRAVAEHTVALMLALTTRIVEADAFARAGKYKGWDPMAFVGTDLSGKTIGLVGMGAIGSEVARILTHGFGCSVYYYDSAPSLLAQKAGVHYCASLEAMLPQVDIVSLHVPLMPETTHYINAHMLSRMKPTALIVNTARGPIIDEQALITALHKKTIAGAALDVFEEEPHIPRALRRMPNVVLTPHIGSARITTRTEMVHKVVQSVIDVLETGKSTYNIWEH